MDAAKWSTVIAGIALVAGTVVSVLSWLAACRSAAAAEKSVEAAEKSAAAAEAMTAIERERRQRDNRPDISIMYTPLIGVGGAELELLLIGPHGVEEVRVDRLEIQDSEPWKGSIVSGSTGEELTVHVRGPYEFRSELTGQAAGGRTVEPFTLIVGYPHKLSLKATSPPQDLIPREVWQRNIHTLPLRVAMECTQEGYEPWRYVFPEIPMNNQLLLPQRSSGA